MAEKVLHFVPLVPSILIHPKPRRVAAILNIRKSEARLLCENLWLYAVQVCPTGILSAADLVDALSFAIENIDTWTSAPTPESATGALVDVGILDRNEGNVFALHGWEDHAGRARPMTVAERVAKHRAKKAACNAKCNEDSIGNVTKCNDDGNDDGNDDVTKCNEQVKLSEFKLTEVKETKENPRTPLPPKGADEYEPEFLELWSLHSQGVKFKAQRSWIKAGRPQAVQNLKNYLEFCQACNRLTVDLSTFFGRDRVWLEHETMQPVPANLARPVARQTQFDPEKY